jgi:hypothetical protein
LHYIKRFIMGGAVGFGITLATFLYWVRYFDVDDYSGFGIAAALFYLSALGAGLGVILGFFTRPRRRTKGSLEGAGLSRAD